MDTAFRSVNFGDVLQAAKKNYWESTKLANKLFVGDWMYITVSGKGCKMYDDIIPDERLVLCGVTSKIKSVEASDPTWRSIALNLSGGYLPHRYHFSSRVFVPILELPTEIQKAINRQGSCAHSYIRKEDAL